MFGKKSKEAGAGKPKKPRDILTDEIDQLAPGQQMMFRLQEIYGPEIIIIDAKKDYQGKGHRYAVIASPPVDGKPGPIRNTMWETSKAKAIADHAERSEVHLTGKRPLPLTSSGNPAPWPFAPGKSHPGRISCRRRHYRW
jgi:hypothetical protein